MKIKIPWALREKIKAHLLPLLLLSLINMRIVTWFSGRGILFEGDFRPFLNLRALLEHATGLWAEIDFGMLAPYFTRLLSPLDAITALLSGILGPKTAEAVAAYLLYLLLSYIAYTLYYLMLDDKLVAFTATFFTTANPLLICDRSPTALGFVNYHYLPTYISLLLFVLSIMRYRSGKSDKLLTFILGFIAGLTSLIAFPNYKPILYFISMSIIILLYYSFKLNLIKMNISKKSIIVMINRTKIKTFIIIYFVFIIGFIISMVPVVFLIYGKIGYMFHILKEAKQANLEHLRHVDPLDVLRFIGRWGFYTGALGRPYIPYRHVYLHNTVFKLLTYIPTVIMFLSLFLSNLFYKRYFSDSIFWLIVFVSSMLVAESFILFDSFYSFIKTNVVMRPLAEPAYLLFYAVFSGSILLGISCRAIVASLREFRLLGWISVGLILLVVSISVYPLFTGEVARNWLSPEYRGYSVPVDLYGKVQSMIDARFWLLLAPRRYTYVIYNESGVMWGAGNPYPKILWVPYVSGLGTEYFVSSSKQFIGRLYSCFHSCGGIILRNVLGLAGVKYVLIEKNIVLGRADDYAVYVLRLSKLPGTRKVFEGKGRILYEIEDVNPIVYVADKILVYDGSWSGLLKALAELDSPIGVAFVDSNYSDIISVVRFASSYVEEFERVGPGHYRIVVRANGPFLLILLESFDEGWSVFVNGRRLNGGHILVNGFANGWVIPLKTGGWQVVHVDIVYSGNVGVKLYLAYLAGIPTVLCVFHFFRRRGMS